MNLQLTLAWRYLNGRKLRTFLTTLAVVFGVMVIFGMNIILPTMLQAFQANMMAAGGLVDATITHQSGGGFPVDVAHKLDGIAGIRAVSASLERTVNLPADFVDGDSTRPDRITALSLVGVDPAAAQSLHAYLVQNGGRFLQAVDTNSTVISQTLADAYGVKLGDTIKVPSVSGTITASATMIGLAIVVALGGMSTSLNGMMGSLLHKSLGSDYLFVPPSIAVWNSDMGSSADFANRLQAIQGVGDISSLRFSGSMMNGQAISLLGINPETYPKGQRTGLQARRRIGLCCPRQWAEHDCQWSAHGDHQGQDG